MKSLKEEVDAIKAAKTTKANKKAALAKLGITPYEIEILLAGVQTTDGLRGRFTFGVEIECFVNRGAIRTAAEATGVAYEYEGYNHRDGHSYFKFVSDGSLTGLPDPIECVSPVLEGNKGKDSLKNMCKTLNRANARVNASCGLHVHIGAASLSGQQYSNVFVNYAMLENVINSFMAPSRRDNTYAMSLANKARDLKNATSVTDVQNILYSRYYKVNAQSYHRHKTIEFRQHGGTTNQEKILNWVNFCGKLVIWSKKNRLTAPVASIDEIAFLTDKEKAFFKGRAEVLQGA